MAESKHAVEACAKIIRGGHAFGTVGVTWRGDRANDTQTSFHRSERFHVGKTQLECFTLAGAELQRIVRGHFRPRLLWVHAGFVSTNQVLVESVLHIGRTVLAVEKLGEVGFVFGEEQLGLTGAEQPAFAVLPVFNLGAHAVRNAGGSSARGAGANPGPRTKCCGTTTKAEGAVWLLRVRDLQR